MSVGLPASMDLLMGVPAIAADIKVSELRIQANGGVASSTEVTVPGTQIEFSVPSVPFSFLETGETMVLRGRLGITVSNNAPGVSLSSAGVFSCFSRIVCKINGQTLQTLANPSIWTNIEVSGYSYDAAQREATNGMLICHEMVGVDASGWDLCPHAGKISLGWGPFVHNDTTYVDFTCPIPCIFTNLQTLYPSALGNLDIEFTMSDISTMVLPHAAGAVAAANGCRLDRMELCVNRVQLSQSVWEKYIKVSPERNISLKTVGVTYNSLVLPANSLGMVELQIPVKLQSVKRIVFSFTNATVREGIHGGINPNLISWCLTVDSKSYPTRRIRLDNRASEQQYQNERALNQVYMPSKGNIPPRYARVSHTADYTGADSGWAVHSDTTAYTPQLWTRAVSNRVFFMLDLETLSAGHDNLFNGTRFPGHASTLLSLEVGTGMNEQYNCHMFCVYDAVIVNQEGIISINQ